MKQPRITVVGSVNVDMMVKTSRLPSRGETVGGGQFMMAAGGKGANQAVAAARLGAEVTFIARVGQDQFGDEAIAIYGREGIRIDRILRDQDSPTGVALIMVDEQGENLISVASGANHRLTPMDVERSADQIRAADVLLLQLEIPIDTVYRAVQIAAGAGVPVVLDPAPAMPLPPELLKNVDYLTPNEMEAAELTGITVNDERSARHAAEKLLAAEARHVILTLGALGALLVGPDGTAFVRSVPVDVVDTTAAGDAFNGAFACGLGRGTSPQDAVRQACIAAALSTTRLGAQPSLPKAEELRRVYEALNRR